MCSRDMREYTQKAQQRKLENLIGTQSCQRQEKQREDSESDLRTVVDFNFKKMQ